MKDLNLWHHDVRCLHILCAKCHLARFAIYKENILREEEVGYCELCIDPSNFALWSKLW